jgi:hypothetical protein
VGDEQLVSAFIALDIQKTGWADIVDKTLV